jgi:hypothetical protein
MGRIRQFKVAKEYSALAYRSTASTVAMGNQHSTEVFRYHSLLALCTSSRVIRRRDMDARSLQPPHIANHDVANCAGAGKRSRSQLSATAHLCRNAAKPANAADKETYDGNQH